MKTTTHQKSLNRHFLYYPKYPVFTDLSLYQSPKNPRVKCQHIQKQENSQNSLKKLKFPSWNFKYTSTFVDDSVDLRKSLTHLQIYLKNWHFMINSGRQKYWQLFAFHSKFVKIDKFLNHVFKTSKKTLSYSRTYCKIYKIANIGKIGRQSRAGILRSRVIYYGSTRSTLSTLLR